MTDTTEGNASTEETTTTVADDGKTEAATEQKAADATTEGGIVVGPDTIGALLEEDADDLDLVGGTAETEKAATEDAEKAEPKVEAEPAAETKVETPVTGEVKPEEKPTVETKPEVAAPEAPTQVQPEETPAVAEPAKKPEVAEPVEAPAPVLTKEQQSEVYIKWRAESENLLATQHYQLSEEVAAELESDSTVAIPKLLSRVYLDAVTASVGHMMSQMPQMIERVISARTSADAAEVKFFDHWAKQGLKTEHRSTVAPLGRAYRTANPNATEQEFIRDVGAQSIVALGLMGTPDAAPAELAPAAEKFQPAAPTAASGARPVVKRNVFDQLTEDMETEELDLD